MRDTDHIICAAMALDDLGSGTAPQDYFYQLMEQAGEQAGRLSEVLLRMEHAGASPVDTLAIKLAKSALWTIYKSDGEVLKLKNALKSCSSLAQELYQVIERM